MEGRERKGEWEDWTGRGPPLADSSVSVIYCCVTNDHTLSLSTRWPAAPGPQAAGLRPRVLDTWPAMPFPGPQSPCPTLPPSALVSVLRVPEGTLGPPGRSQRISLF